MKISVICCFCWMFAVCSNFQVGLSCLWLLWIPKLSVHSCTNAWPEVLAEGPRNVEKRGKKGPGVVDLPLSADVLVPCLNLLYTSTSSSCTPPPPSARHSPGYGALTHLFLFFLFVHVVLFFPSVRVSSRSLSWSALVCDLLARQLKLCVEKSAF